MKKIWGFGFIAILAFSLNVFAEGIDENNYDIYYGDVDGNGTDEYYFHGKPKLVLLHGDVVVPVQTGFYESFWYRGARVPDCYGMGTDSNGQPIINCPLREFVDFSVIERLSGSQLSQLQKLDDGSFITGDFNGDGITELFNKSGYVLHFNEETGELVLDFLSPSDSNMTRWMRLLADGYSFEIKDVNNDGIDDIVVLGATPNDADVAFLSGVNGIATGSKLVLNEPTALPVTLVGVSEGGFRVSESGAATYTQNLYTPAGTAGVAPSLSLNYSSHAGNGQLGVGWGLSGISSITRCQQTRVQDNNAQALTWGVGDKFCLDGQRLVLVSTGEYGENLSEYKTEIDTGVTVTAYGGANNNPDHFIVSGKDGSKNYFGNTIDSKVVLDNEVTYQWFVSQSSDNLQNSIFYTYENDANSRNRIASIEYGVGPTKVIKSDSQVKIEFNYELRPDVISGYIGGSLTKEAYRLKEVVVKDSTETVRNYHLRYKKKDFSLGHDPSQNTSRITHIQECILTDCFEPTRFDWTIHEKSFEQLYLPENISDTDIVINDIDSVAKIVPADVDGDGRLDVIVETWEGGTNGTHARIEFRYSSEDGTRLINDAKRNPRITLEGDISSNPDSRRKWAVVDYNNDGRSDVITWKKDAPDFILYLSHYNFQTKAWGITGVKTVVSIDGAPEASHEFLDLNGDGLVDAVGSEKIWLQQKNPSFTEATSSYDYLPYNFSSSIPVEWFRYHNFPRSDYDFIREKPKHYKGFADFNGDGATDAIVYREVVAGVREFEFDERKPPIETALDRGVFIATLSGANKFSKYHRVVAPNGNLGKDDIVIATDINADGLIDLIFEKNDIYYYQLNTGNGFSDVTFFQDLTNSNSDKQSEVHPFDANGDGYMDLAYTNGNGRYYLSFWNGTAFVPHEVKMGVAPTDYYTPVVFSYTNSNARWILTDINQDGRPDIVNIGVGKGSLRLSTIHDKPDNVITGFTNGLGAKTNIEYARLNNTPHYNPIGVDCSSATCDFDNPHEYNIDAWFASRFALNSFYDVLQNPFDLQNLTHFISIDKPISQLHRQYLVVTGVDSPAPIPSSRSSRASLEYHYGQAYVQAGGKGVLGFKEMSTLDKQSGVLTKNEYRLDFPFTGMPQKTTVYAEDNSIISESISEWRLYGYQESWSSTVNQSGTVALAPYQPYLYQSVDKKYNTVTDIAKSHGFRVTDELLSTSTTTSEVDEYGNKTKVTSLVESLGDTFESITVNDYGTDPFDLEMARLQKTSVTYKSTVGDVVKEAKRESSFNYYLRNGPPECNLASNEMKGMLCQEIIEPDTAGSESTAQNSTPYRMLTTYQYDDMGNVTSIGTGETGGTVRTTTTEYDEYGRYANKTINALNQVVSTVIRRNKFGKPSEVKTLNGNTIETEFDAAGRVTRTSDSTGSYSETDLKSCDVIACPQGAVYAVEKRAAGGSKSITYFDILTRPMREGVVGFNGDWVYVDTEYDIVGRVVRKSEPFFETSYSSFWTSTTYDHLGRVLTITAPDDSSVTNTYEGFSIHSINDKGQKKTETKTVKGEIAKVIDHNDTVLRYAYDAQGNLEKVETAVLVGEIEQVDEKLTVYMDYDVLGRKTAMRDPDKGEWSYKYNAYGELVEQEDSKGQRIVNKYDILGRVYERTDYTQSGGVEKVTHWHFDDHDDLGRPVNNAKGKVTAVVQSNSIQHKTCAANSATYCERYEYDQYGRSLKTHTLLGVNGAAGVYTNKVTYDHIGRVENQYDVLGGLLESEAANGAATSGVRNTYKNGYLWYVTDLASGNNVYEIVKQNERGQVTQEKLANTAKTYYDFFPESGRLKSQRASFNEQFIIQDIEYTWDTIGNLTSRRNQSSNPFNGQQQDRKESFCYDELNRLIKTFPGTINGSCDDVVPGSQDLRYDRYGNIEYKKGVGGYLSYGSGKISHSNNQLTLTPDNAGVHAVTKTADGVEYTYDRNGNLISDTSGRTLQYTVFDKVSQITKGNHQINFRYGPNRNRFERIDKNTQNGETTTTQYLGSIERIVKSTAPNNVEWKRYLPGGAIFTVTTTINSAGKHILQGTDGVVLYKDHLGSSDVMTDLGANVIHAMSFDPWGERRNPWTWADFSNSQLLSYRNVMTNGLIQLGSKAANTTTRGFTGHEMLDEVGLIHMNGRIYDPRLARFIQADPVIDGVTNPQGFNRYAYLHNNPLNATDPTGFSRWTEFRDSILKPVVQAVVSFYCPPCGAALAAATTLYYGGSIGDAAKAAAMNYAFSKLGKAQGLNFVQKTIAISTLSGVQSVMNGGSFGNGFATAGLSSLAGAGLNMAFGGGMQGAVIAGAIVGGTVSELTGGKFANGAITGAFVAALTYQEPEVQKQPKPNITGSDKVAFVGGFGDNNDALHKLGLSAPTVRDKYNAYVAANGADSAAYFEWTQGEAIKTYVADNNGRVTIVAHSYGADTTGGLVAAGMQVHKLVTVDPVGWSTPNMQAVSNNVVTWINYDSTGGMLSHPSNFVGAIGGAWNSRPDGYATQHIPSSKNHVDICSTFCVP